MSTTASTSLQGETVPKPIVSERIMGGGQMGGQVGGQVSESTRKRSRVLARD